MFKIFQCKFTYKSVIDFTGSFRLRRQDDGKKGDARSSRAWQSNKQNSTGSFTLWVQDDVKKAMPVRRRAWQSATGYQL